MRLLSNLKLFTALMVLVKVVLSAVTPLGYDFGIYIRGAITHDQTLAYSPWINFVQVIYDTWLAMPFDHGNPLLAFTNPMLLMPSHYLLTVLVKSPLVISDFMAGYLIYRMAARLTGSASIAQRATILWLVNPFVTFFAEMWGSIDIVVTAFAFGSIVLMVQGRRYLSSTAVFVGIILRLSPILTWFTLVVWAIRTKMRQRQVVILFLSGCIGVFIYVLWVGVGIVVGSFATTLQAFFLVSSNYTPVTQAFTEYSLPDAFIGLASSAIVLFVLLAAWLWPSSDGWDLIALTLSATLIVYGLAFWFPTAFIWSIPFLVLLNARGWKLGYTIIFDLLMSFYVILFYADIITTQGSSLLFIPVVSVPLLVGFVQYVSSLPTALITLDPFFLSAFTGFGLAFAGSIIYETFRRRKED